MLEEIEKLENNIMEMKSRLAELRRAVISQEVSDYQLTGPDGEKTSLSQLFGEKKDLLVIHNMGKSCPYCTLWADGINGVIDHIENRTSLVLVSPDPPEVQKEFASSRGWKYRMLSSIESGFSRAMGFEVEKEGRTYHLPGASGFRLGEDGKICRVSSTFFGPGDDFCSVWHLYDLLQDGHAEWQPKYSY
jgi:predicted dithiol-disulfide oxidoreductase (DUF899 family)